MPAKTALLIALAILTVLYAVDFFTSLRRALTLKTDSLVTGFVTNFFDTLGIGSFATTTAIFKFRNMVPDERIPATLNVGHTLPVIFQAFIYIAVIEVDFVTLTLLIASAALGGWVGVGLVSGLSKRAVQLGMGGMLLLAAAAMIMRQFELFPAGGDALQLQGWRLAVGIVCNFIFGALSALGIGFYAPCITMISLLGMNPVAAFPIMMGSSAFLMPVASMRFLRKGAYLASVAAGLTIGGMVGVPIAAFAVKSLPLNALRWLVIVIVLYAAVLMIRSANGVATQVLRSDA